MQVGHSLTSYTANIESVVIDPSDRFQSLKNYRVVIVDTPGFDGTIVGDIKILQQIEEWLTASCVSPIPGFHGSPIGRHLGTESARCSAG